MARSSEISATRFRARCLRLLDEVAETGRPLVITKHGKPVARLVPAGSPGDLRSSATLRLSDEDLVSASMGSWDVEHG